MDRNQSKVLFDTNFLLIPSRFGVDIFAESERALNQKPEFIVTKSILEEIKILKQDAKPSFRRNLTLAQKLAEQCKVVDDHQEKDEEVDDAIIRVSTNNNYIVGTTDAELRKRLHGKGVKVLFLRQRNFLMLE